MIWLTAALQAILLYQVAHTKNHSWDSGPLRYFDYARSADLFFDRLAGLTLNVSNDAADVLTMTDKLNVAVGVWITSDRILTSYNPFRSILRNKTLLHLLLSTALTGRKRPTDNYTIYKMEPKRLACGRQIQWLPDEQIDENKLWHDAGRVNCPLHDLMVFRIHGKHKVSTLTTEEHTMALFPVGDTMIHQDIFLTEIAQPHEQMGARFRFAYIYYEYLIRVSEYDPDDEGIVDCDEWLPRAWGRFICLRNKDNFKSLASSAMLVSNEKLFGVGSFILFRGKEGILVFTDVRPYYDNIHAACTFNETGEPEILTFPEDKELSELFPEELVGRL